MTRTDVKMMWADTVGRKKMIAAGLWLAVSLFLFYCFIYNDILETMRVGISFWSELFEGRIHYFYAGRWEMTPFAYTKVVQAVYDFPIYIVFAVWNFPLWIAEHFFGVDVFGSAACLMWGKTLLLAASVIITRAIFRLCITLDMEKEKAGLVCLLFLTSNFFLASIIMMCAYDIIALYFAIEGMNFYFRDNRKGFLVCFMLSIPLKFFSLLLFVPLLLLREKRIPYIAGYTFMSVLPIIVFRILLPCRAVYGDPETVAFHIKNALEATELSGLAILYTVAYEQPAALSRMYPSMFAWITILLLCYFVKFDTQEKLKKWGIYICFLMYAAMFVTCMSHPYWLLIMVPMMVIVMGQNDKYLYVNLVLETLLTWGMIFAQIFKFSWCFGNAIVAGMFLPQIFGAQNAFVPVTPLTVLEKLSERDVTQGYLIGAGCTLFIAGIFLFSLINFPAWKIELPFINKGEKPAWWLIGVRVVSGFAIACIPIVLHVLGLRLG